VKETKSAYKILKGIPEGKRPLKKPRSRWEDSITKNNKETGWELLDWINLAQEWEQ
jgi:hypothetical protein